MTTTDFLLEALMKMMDCRLEAYEGAAGIPTIGYGHTHNVRMGDKISAWYAKDLLSEDIAYFVDQVKEMNVAKTEGQLDALVSLALSLGIDRLKQSTLLVVIREGGSKNEIKREFKRFVFADGKKSAGLVKRREWEARRFFE